MAAAFVRVLAHVALGAGLLWGAAAMAQTAADEAGDVSEVDKDRVGPLRERIRPVSGHLFLKAGRFEISPSVTVSVKDAFFTKYLLGASLTYHPIETFGINAWFGYGLNVVSGAAQICTSEGAARGCRLPTMQELTNPAKRAQGEIGLSGGLDAQWAPIYGKLGLIAEKFLHFDMYGILGGAAVQYGGPSGAEMTVGGNVGVGMRFVVNRFITVRTELRDLIYFERVPSGGSSMRNQMVFGLGCSFFLPTSFQEG